MTSPGQPYQAAAGRSPDQWRWRHVRTNGCRAPVCDGPLDTFYCVKCDRPVYEHPLDDDTRSRWYLLPEGQTDEHSLMLEILEA